MAFFIASLVNYLKIMNMVTKKRMLLYWRITFILTLFFMIGYIYKTYELLTIPESSDLMVSLVYMFGALFVLIITWLSVETLKGLVRKKK
jgi:hypothetical protein